jgi:hypothetical protein
MIYKLEAGASLPTFDLNQFLGGGVVALVVGIAYFVIRLLFDRAIPTKSDGRESISLVVESLNATIKIMQEDRASDVTRLQTALDRTDRLESDAAVDYTKLNELRAEIVDLRNRLVRKDQHISTLITELRKLGIAVIGYKDDTSGPLQIIYPREPPFPPIPVS